MHYKELKHLSENDELKVTEFENGFGVKLDRKSKNNDFVLLWKNSIPIFFTKEFQAEAFISFVKRKFEKEKLFLTPQMIE